LLRPEDIPLITGEARFVADIDLGGALEAVFVRSWAAHALVRAVEVSRALCAPGVKAVYRAEDLARIGDVPAGPQDTSPAAMARRPLCGDRVRFVGDPVALVVADNRYQGEDAAALVEVDLELLEPVLDGALALEPGAPELFPGWSNLAAEVELGMACAEQIAKCPVIVETVVDNQRVAPMSLEARAILAAPVEGGVHVYCSSQAPHRLQGALAAAFSLPLDAIKVTVPFVGGAFGAKSQVYPEYLAVVAAALDLERPVRWIEDRAEAFTAGTHGRGQRTRARLGLSEDGRFQALEVDILADVGAYPQTGGFLPKLTAWMMSGPYAIASVHVRARSVLTTTTPTASYRGAGRPEAAYALERLVEAAAVRLGVDSIELRRKNLVPEDAFPYRSPTGACYDSGRYASALDAALEALDLPAVRAEQARRRAHGACNLLGVGVACWIERTGGEAGSKEFAEVVLSEEGTLVAYVGTASQGQGHLITFAQVVAEATGVDPGEVQVVLGDTDQVREGTGAFGSRSMQIGGSALYLAALDVLAQAREAGAQILGVEPSALIALEGRFVLADGTRGLSLAEIGRARGPLRAERRFASPQAFPFGCYGALVEVERATGAVRVERLVAVDDVGVVVNPMIVEGQIIGSIAQGVGQALVEHARFDAAGNPVTTTLLDYHVPTIFEMPEIELVAHVTANPNVPLGTKGAGESGTIGAPPAIANAIVDALQGYDTSELKMPFTSERVWACLQRPL
jgi:carbon-monoxide dehydrogenase large subunit